MEKRVYRPRQVAEMLGVNLNTVYKEVHSYLAGGLGLPAFKIGTRTIRIPVKGFAAYEKHGPVDSNWETLDSGSRDV